MNITVELIKQFEGCRFKAYKDVAGTWTIGYGSTGKDVKPGVVWTQKQCEMRLANDLQVLAARMKFMIKVLPTPNQMAAMTSFAYNEGIGRFEKSELLLKFNSHDFNGAADDFLKYIKAGGEIIPGLLARRKKERELFLT